MNEQDKYLLKVDKILKNPKLGRDAQFEAISDLIKEILIEEGAKAFDSKPKSHHWPGMYSAQAEETIYAIGGSGGLIVSIEGFSLSEINDIRMGTNCFKTRKEAEYVKAHLQARLEVIDRLTELNNGWIPDWKNDDLKYEIMYRRLTDEIEIKSAKMCSYLPDCFQAKSQEIWERIINEFSPEKVKLALWPNYKEKNET